MTANLALVTAVDQPSALAEQWPLDRWDLRLYGSDVALRWVTFRGRPDRSRQGATGVHQDWLLAITKEWVHRALLRQL
ncbi:MAG: hypothetical protein KGQ66_23580 [Acidobacteriota bacterium]|nr:hypothetical protein [Acidobacteriota bacterium]